MLQYNVNPRFQYRPTLGRIELKKRQQNKAPNESARGSSFVVTSRAWTTYQGYISVVDYNLIKELDISEDETNLLVST